MVTEIRRISTLFSEMSCHREKLEGIVSVVPQWEKEARLDPLIQL